MQDSMYRYLKPGTIFFKSFPECEPGHNGEQIIRRARQIAEDIFFSVVEVGKIDDMLDRSIVCQILENAGLEVVYATQPYFFGHRGHANSFRLNLCDTNAERRKNALSIMRTCLVEACDLKATQVRIISGYMPEDPKDVPEAKKCLIDSISQIMEWAPRYGNPVVTLKIFDTDVTAKQLIGKCDDALEIAQALCPTYDHFGLLTDYSHFPLLRENPRETLTKLAPYLKAFHLGNTVVEGDPNSLVYGDTQPRYGIPHGAHGVEDIADYFRILNDLGLIGPDKRPVVSAEVRPIVAGEDAELILANSKRVYQTAWALA